MNQNAAENAGRDSTQNSAKARQDAGATAGAITLRLPATSANLGPAFDSAGLAMALTLTIEAESSPAPGAPPLSIHATGRNADRCARTSNNMIFETYRDVLQRAGRSVTPLSLRVHNEIPLGMGCGSSAAALLGGVMLASHFGRLGWDLHACMEEACRREGHPDNVAACALGYMTLSAESGGSVVAATCGEGLRWKLLLALPTGSLPTERARALLPTAYSRADAVSNVQRTGLLVAAFALGRGDLLRVAMQDRLHQPYRLEACPLLPLLMPLAGVDGVLGVALSGAGPGVLLVAEPDANLIRVAEQIRSAASDPALEIIETSIASGALQSLAR
jgi:homoserine kinase